MSGVPLAFLLLAMAGPDGPPDPRPIAVTATAESRSFHVGGSISVEVAADGATAPIRIEAPQVAGAEVRRVESDGAVSDPAKANFLVIPERAGPLVILPFKVHAEGRVGSSGVIRRMVRDVPSEGRPSSFLGGVGPFEATSRVEPESLVVGSTAEYRITIVGPAALGSRRPPDLGGWPAKLPGLRIRPVAGSESSPLPPSRTFRFQIRPTRPGRWTLPPVAVAAYDPDSHRYQTRYTAGVPIEAALHARPDPGPTIPSPTISARSGIQADRSLMIGVGVVLAAGLAAFLGFRRAKHRKGHPNWIAGRIAARLDPAWSGEIAACRIAESLAEYLRAQGRAASGVLTPKEVEEAMSDLIEEPDLASRCRRLMEGCDRARFGGGEGRGLVEEARMVFRDLASRVGRRSSVGRAVGGSRDRDASQ